MFTWSLTGWDDFYSIVMWEPFKHLRIKFTHRKCVVQTISQVKWRWFYSGMRGFNCLVVVLFSYVFMLSTRFVRTSGNGLCHKTWSHFLFAQHLEALWWTCLRYDSFFPYAGNWRINLKNWYSSHFARSVRAVIVQLNGVLAIWPHKRW